MAKYLVSTGSHYTPFTYDELAKPAEYLRTQHDKAQAIYDDLSTKKSLLEQYITDNEGDSEAKALYDSYSSQLSSLQDDLWSNGYSANTARQIADARSGYSSKIGKLSDAIRRRQEVSKLYTDKMQSDRTLLAEDNPGKSGLNNFLNDEFYGTDFYSYSGNKFTDEVKAELATVADAMLRSPSIHKNPSLANIYERITTIGTTLDEVMNARNAVYDYYNNNENPDTLRGLSIPESLLANTLISQLSATNAKGNLSDENFNRLIDYGARAFTSTLGKQQYDEIDMSKAGNGTIAGSGGLSDTFTLSGPAEGYTDALDEYMDIAGMDNINSGEHRYISQKSGELNGNIAASAAVYSEEERLGLLPVLGFDFGRDGNSFKTGKAHGRIQDEDGNIYETYLDRTFRDQVRIRKVGDPEFAHEPPKKWPVDTERTRLYRQARENYNKTIDYYKDNEPDIYKAAKNFTPNKRHDFIKKYELSEDMPSTDFKGLVFGQDKYAPKLDMVAGYISRDGGDSGKIGKQIAGYIKSSLPFDGTELEKIKKINRYDGNSSLGIHKLNENGTVDPEAVQPVDVFDTDEGGSISNITDVFITADGLKNKYICINTTKGTYTVALNMLKSKQLNNAFANIVARVNSSFGKNAFDNIELQDTIVSSAAPIIQRILGFDQRTVSKSSTEKEK